MTWQRTRPPASGFLVSSEVRGNWQALDGGALFGVNLSRDPLFQHSAGINKFWTESGTGATIEKTGAGESDTEDLDLGGYACLLTYGSATAYLTETLHATLPAYYQGKDFSLGGMVQSGSSNAARLFLDDGVSKSYSSYHTGGGADEWLYLTKTLDGSASELSWGLELVSGTAYVAGLVPVFGPVPPLLYSPPSNPLYVSSDTALTAGRPVVLAEQYNTVSSTGAGELDAHSVTIDADRWFSEAGDELLIESWCDVTNSTWALKHYINGSSVHVDTAAGFYDLGFGGGYIRFHAITRLVYVTATTQQVFTTAHQWLSGAGTHRGDMLNWPVTGNNPNGGLTTGTGDIIIKETLSDAHTDLDSHGFKVTATKAP